MCEIVLKLAALYSSARVGKSHHISSPEMCLPALALLAFRAAVAVTDSRCVQSLSLERPRGGATSQICVWTLAARLNRGKGFMVHGVWVLLMMSSRAHAMLELTFCCLLCWLTTSSGTFSWHIIVFGLLATASSLSQVPSPAIQMNLFNGWLMTPLVHISLVSSTAMNRIESINQSMVTNTVDKKNGNDNPNK